ncbi:MAG: carboxypeptidase regulatory-like domain-containing protein [Candidatus Aenigmarchaeota archaeon]|nr:carboxypeptidase regulatory-like domain-containing protein [Candidatus Aenigmarchaeota archaeon]
MNKLLATAFVLALALFGINTAFALNVDGTDIPNCNQGSGRIDCAIDHQEFQSCLASSTQLINCWVNKYSINTNKWNIVWYGTGGCTGACEGYQFPKGSSSVYLKVKPTFVAPTQGILSVTVLDNFGNPISGATVSAQSTSTDSTGTTNANGNVIFTLPAGTYAITVTKSGYQAQIKTSTVTAGSTSLVTFYLVPVIVAPATGTLAVKVTDNFGNPLSGAQVNVQSTVTDPIGFTGSDGFVYFNVPAGSYTITASKSGYQTRVTTALVREFQTSNVFISLATISPVVTSGALSVRVVDNFGNPLASARVDVSAPAFDPTEFTDSSGFAYFTLSPGAYTVAASKSGYQSSSRTASVFAGQTTFVTIVLNPIAISPNTGTLMVTVTDGSTGAPISGATVSAQSTSTDPIDTTNANGNVIFTLPAGTYAITVTKSGYQLKQAARIVYAGQTTSVQISLSPVSVQPPSQASISATVTTPTSTAVGQTISTTVTFTNTGTASGTVSNINVYICAPGGTSCQPIPNCTNLQVTVASGSSQSITCSTIATAVGTYQVRVDYTKPTGDPTIFSGTFTVSPTPSPTPTPTANTCSLGLDFTSLSNTNIASGDVLTVLVRERMTFTGFTNPWATVAVSVEGPATASLTQVYTFSSSGSTAENTFNFPTTNWPVGTYKVYVESTGVSSCSTISKTQLGTVQVNPATTSSITSVSSASVGNAIYVQKFAETTPEEKPVVKTQVAYPTVSMTETSILWEQVALVGLVLLIPIAVAGTWYFARKGSLIAPVVQHDVHRSQGWEECTDHELLPKGI